MTRASIRRLAIVCVGVSAGLLSVRLMAINPLNLPKTPYRYASDELPAYFMHPERDYDNTPADNPITDDGATLGRVLFYDTRLSANDTVSCGSCHVQAHAFADPRPSSRGFHGELTDRRAMPLVNVRYYRRARFFWDERAGNLEAMVLMPVTSRIEMGQDMSRVVRTLSLDRTYAGLFIRAFGDPRITEDRIGKALAQFVRSLVSSQSRYDQGRAHARSARDDFENFTRAENRGKALFMRHCASCHMKEGNEHFLVQTPATTRLPGDDLTSDAGVGEVTLRTEDLGSFKSPSLRNVEVAGPYGHDGRFATLGSVIDHYSANPIFDPNLGYTFPVGPLDFTTSEKAALIAFLSTLTDRSFLSDPRFSNPFTPRPRLTTVADAFEKAPGRLANTAAAATETLVLLRSPATLPQVPPSPSATRARSSHPVVQRLLFLDVNGDRRVSRDELPERLQALLARGDRNNDAALDQGELEALVSTRVPERPQVQVHCEASDGLSGVIDDLKLPAEKQMRAHAFIRRRPLAFAGENAMTGALRNEMKALLDNEEYENFLAAARRVPPRRASLLRHGCPGAAID